MLKTPEQFLGLGSEVLALIAEARGSSDPPLTVLEEGVVKVYSFNLDTVIFGRNPPFYMGYPAFDFKHDLTSYGVCDNPAQFLEKYRELLEVDPRTFVVGFTHVAKDPSNKGRGGGWRWHKWGPYIGKAEPQCEYLDDEEGFEDGVYVYSIVQTAGPHLEYDWKVHKLVEKSDE